MVYFESLAEQGFQNNLPSRVYNLNFLAAVQFGDLCRKRLQFGDRGFHLFDIAVLSSCC